MVNGEKFILGQKQICKMPYLKINIPCYCCLLVCNNICSLQGTSYSLNTRNNTKSRHETKIMYKIPKYTYEIHH